jgi:glycosyltransferase involved in cell wall biosynthesis
MKCNVLFIPIGEECRASSRFRVWQMMPHLENLGFSCKAVTYIKNIGGQGVFGAIRRKLISRFIVEKEILRLLGWADVVVIQEALLSKSLLKLMKKLNKKVIFDFSDPIHLMHLDTGLSLLQRALFLILQRPKFLLTLEISESAIVENDSLTKLTNQLGCSSYVMRGPIDCEKFTVQEKKCTSEVVLGWTGSPGTFGLIKPLLPLINKLGESYDLKLILVGCGQQDIQLSNVSLVIEPWTIDNERKIIPQFDIGLFNLKDTIWDKARGGGKLFVYMACGVPFISPNLGIGKQIYNESKAGILVASEDKWQEALLELIKNYKYRKELSMVARKYAEDVYSHKAYLNTWKKILIS